MLSVLHSLYHTLLLEFFMNVLESNSQDVFYLQSGLLCSDLLIIENHTKIPELKKNELRIRNDLDGLKFLVKKIQENSILIKNNNKIINVNEGIMIYLQKLQKKKYNLILMLMLNELNIVRKTEDLDFIKKIKIFLEKLYFNKTQKLSKLDNKIYINEPLIEENINKFIGPLYNDISDIMKITKKEFMENKTIKKINFNPLFLFEKNFYSIKDCLDMGLIELSKSKRTQLATHLSEIITKTNELVNKKGIYELQNIYKFENVFNKIIKVILFKN